MSTFKVSLTKVGEILPHPGADRLDLAKVEGLGYQFCVQKGGYATGDEVVYFPIDSLVPAELADYLGIRKLLGGKGQDRVKTVKLRGEVSQGLVVGSPSIRAFLEAKGTEWPTSDLTSALGVEKYEPPEISCHAGNLVRLPEGVPVYDIESADNFLDVLGLLMDSRVWVTEKAEGTNFSVTVDPSGSVFVNQRNYSISPIDGQEHDFWKAAREFGYIDAARKVQERLFSGQKVTLRGELIGPGVQKNIYRLKKREVLFFDVLVDGRYMDCDTWADICSYFDMKTVPILARDIPLREWLGGADIRKASDGKSELEPSVLREGIVIKPSAEGFHPSVGRLMLKQRSPEYLAKSDL